MFDSAGLPELTAVTGMEDAGLIDILAGASRLESAAMARRLFGIGELYLRRQREREETWRWVVDPWEQVVAEVAAALGISRSRAHYLVGVGLRLRKDLPAVAGVFANGDIDFRVVAAIERRTELVTNSEIMEKLDAVLARKAPKWMKLSGPKLADCIDQWVARFDPAGVEQQPQPEPNRYVDIAPARAAGMAGVWAQVRALDAAALDKRLDELAATVCSEDPRTQQQRRADALGALAAGNTALRCTCGSAQCPGSTVNSGPKVVVHVVADSAAVEGATSSPGYLPGLGVLPGGMLADVLSSATCRPLVLPKPGLWESGYRPSAALAQFVRCRDLTCRFPGCDRPAEVCDIDHTVPYPGGPTAASNLKLLCRHHHLLKTFCSGWTDRQLPDGTLIWFSPTGHTYTTHPAGALLFPVLGQSTGPIPTRPNIGPTAADPTVMMPLRQRSRAKERQYRIARQRRDNQARLDERKRQRQLEQARLITNDEPPPF